ncbi:GNAT family protein [Streptomyces sp. NPDC044571]|uniref:GNAT family N-acetyltransferase n=1 Tax=Streptomyces sp. NPDC044571 TaxID=3155371 RepID=UPI0033C1A65A
MTATAITSVMYGCSPPPRRRSSPADHGSSGPTTDTRGREALSLRPFDAPADSPLLRSWIASRADLLTWAGPAFTWPLDDAQLSAYAAEPDRHIWTARAADGRALGHISVRGTRLGRVLIAPEARGRGLGETLLTLAIDRAFDELDLPELDLGVYTHNTRAVRLYEKLGFRSARVLPDVEEVDGVRWSALQMRLPRPRR